jgi:hypothetical protein
LFDKNLKLNELSAFFVAVANPAGESVVPIDDKVNEDVLKQMFGIITQAGRTKVLSIANDYVCNKV